MCIIKNQSNYGELKEKKYLKNALSSPIILVLGMFVYIFLGGLAFNLIKEDIHDGNHWVVAFFALIWALGWITIIFGMISGSFIQGINFARYWLATVSGSAIALAPLVWLPHPIIIILGVLIGFGLGTFIATGKILKIIEIY